MDAKEVQKAHAELMHAARALGLSGFDAYVAYAILVVKRDGTRRGGISLSFVWAEGAIRIVDEYEESPRFTVEEVVAFARDFFRDE